MTNHYSQIKEKRSGIMGKVNLKVRIKSKTFLTSLIALLLVLANQISGAFGYDIELISMEITHISETVLIILGLLGIINDPTTSNGFLGDVKDVLEYDKPYRDED